MSTDSTPSKPSELNVAVVGSFGSRDSVVCCYSDVRSVAEAREKFKAHVVASYGFYEDDAGAKHSVHIDAVLQSSAPIHRHS